MLEEACAGVAVVTNAITRHEAAVLLEKIDSVLDVIRCGARPVLALVLAQDVVVMVRDVIAHQPNGSHAIPWSMSRGAPKRTFWATVASAVRQKLGANEAVDIASFDLGVDVTRGPVAVAVRWDPVAFEIAVAPKESFR